MNYILLMIVALTSLPIGFLVGFSRGTSNIDEVIKSTDVQEEMRGFLDSVVEPLNVQNIQALHTMEHISLLEELEKNDLDAIKAFLLDSVSRSYKLSQEAIDTGMASDGDIEIVERVNSLSGKSALFGSVTRYKE